MELEEFIKKSLLGISNGLKSANDEIEGGGKTKFIMGPYNGDAGNISFDVAVVATDKSGGDVDAGIKVLGSGISSDISYEKRNEQVSRIVFHVKPGQYTDG